MLGVKAYNSFGMSEMCGPGVGFECKEQNGLHFWEDYYIVEIVDPETLETGCGSDPLFGINYGRDLGIDLFGQLFDGKLFYNLEFLNGRGINAKDPDNRKNVIVKLDYRPIQGLRFAVSAQKGYATSLVPMSVYIPVENAIAQGEIYRRNRWTAGVEYKAGSNDFWRGLPG